MKVSSNANQLLTQILSGEVWPPLADRHGYRVDPRGDEPCGQLVGLRTGPPERRGVSDQPGIEAVRDRRVDLHAPFVEHIAHQHRCRFRTAVDQVRGPEVRIRRVMVDRKRLLRTLGPVTQRTESAQAAAVDRNEQIDLTGDLLRGHQ